MSLNERNDIGQLLKLAQRDFQHRLAKVLADNRVRGISQAQGSVITHLFSQGSSRLIEIANANNIKPQSLIKVINELETMGYVLRSDDPNDSRAKLITLTKAGTRHIAHLSDATEAVWQQYADELGTKEAHQFFDTLRQLIGGH